MSDADEGSLPRPRRVGWPQVDAAGLATWMLAVALVLYLALNNGGYDELERGALGVAVWWAVLVGTSLGILPAAGYARGGRLALALLAAFAAWTALALIWTESEGRTMTEVARVTTFLGVLALALAVQANGRWRPLLHGVTAAVGIVCALALLSRLEPTLFPERVTGQYLAGIEIERRLAYPLNYSSGLGAFAAIAMPLLLAATASARTLPAQALAAAALPVAALTLWLTSSSLALPVAAIGLLAFLVLAPDRLPKLVTLAAAAGGSAILFAALERRDALDRGLPTKAAQVQGDELLVTILLVCAGIAVTQIAIGLAVRRWQRPAWLRISPLRARVAAAGLLVAVLVAAFAAGVPGAIADRWDDFKLRGASSTPADSRSAQILDPSGSGRYEFWQSAVDANAESPLIGIGPGTYEFWWARAGSYAGFVRDAHSLYVETLAELGVVGLLLIAGLSATVLVLGAWRALRAPPPLRLALAAATAGCAAFVAAATVDWVWELGVLPVVFMILAAIAVAAAPPTDSPSPPRADRPRRRDPHSIAVVVASVVALVAIGLPLAAAVELQRSDDSIVDGRLDAALTHARNAGSLQPYAAPPLIQQALIEERRGKLDAAAKTAREAARKEPTSWRNWAIVARLEARRGNRRAARAAQREARSLNPLSGRFAR